MGGRGENIWTSRAVGAEGAGAVKDALSSGESAGSTRPGGGRTEAEMGVRKVRLGLIEMGVPSSSKSACCGGVMGATRGFLEGFELQAAMLWLGEQWEGAGLPIDISSV